MAWNPSPEVAAARDFGKKFDAKRVIILHVKEDNTFGYVSYGRNRDLCDKTKDLAERIFPEFENELLKEIGRHGNAKIKITAITKIFAEFRRRLPELEGRTVSPETIADHLESRINGILMGLEDDE